MGLSPRELLSSAPSFGGVAALCRLARGKLLPASSTSSSASSPGGGLRVGCEAFSVTTAPSLVAYSVVASSAVASFGSFPGMFPPDLGSGGGLSCLDRDALCIPTWVSLCACHSACQSGGGLWGNPVPISALPCCLLNLFWSVHQLAPSVLGFHDTMRLAIPWAVPGCCEPSTSQKMSS